jgi:hypothetical protein
MSIERNVAPVAMITLFLSARFPLWAMTLVKCTRVGFCGSQTGGLRRYSPGSFTDVPITQRMGKRQKVRTTRRTA